MQQKQSLQDQFVSYEIALKLKELGFDEECLGIYIYKDDKGILVTANNIWYNHARISEFILAPLYQQVIDWFRDIYKINIHVSNSYCYPKFSFDIEYSGEMGPVELWYCSNEAINNFYEAKERAILKAIELIKKSE